MRGGGGGSGGEGGGGGSQRLNQKLSIVQVHKD